MLDLIFVVRRGPLKNLTLQSIKFEYYGGHTKLPVIECDTFTEGFKLAQGYKYALFLDSGTVFVDVKEFLADLKKYPHQGLIGHIIDPLNTNRPFYLNRQAFLLELDKFDITDFEEINFITNIASRSVEDIHDKYTPLWIKGTGELNAYSGQYFGAKLIAKQFSRGKLVVNFKQILRKNKLYLYNENLVAGYLKTQQAYCDVAENQLWVFNNEAYHITVTDHLVAPASGLFWILHALNQPKQIDLVDISRAQLAFAQALWSTWDGSNYGKFVSDYIKTNNINHYLIDNKPRTKMELLQLSKPSVLIETVNTMFAAECQEHTVTNFQERWQQAQATTQVTFNNRDLLDYIQAHHRGTTWMSNILDYKYTMLKHHD